MSCSLLPYFPVFFTVESAVFSVVCCSLVFASQKCVERATDIFFVTGNQNTRNVFFKFQDVLGCF